MRCTKCGVDPDQRTSGQCLCPTAYTVSVAPTPNPTPYKCPVCDGTGKVSRPPWVAGDVPSWGSNTIEHYDCRACDGGIVWGPPAVVSIPSVFSVDPPLDDGEVRWLVPEGLTDS